MSPRLHQSPGAHWKEHAAGYASAVAGVAVITVLIHLVPGATHIANISMLYLLVVIGMSLRFGGGPAVAASLLAFLAFDWFFTQPVHTFTVHDPAEWLALFVFLFVAVVTGHLTALLQARADEARRRERETAALAEASWAVASQVDRDHALAEVLRRLADVVEVRSAAILVPEDGGRLFPVAAHASGVASFPDFDERRLADGARLVLERSATVGLDGEQQHWQKALGGSLPPGAVLLPLVAESRTLGVLYLRPAEARPLAPDELRVVRSLAHHAAVILERERLARAETAARALVEADRLKTALLSMVSHDFRSPLSSIKASASALFEEGSPLDPATQHELLAGIEQEADRLNRMVGNILALSRLEADAWRPQSEATDPAELIGTALAAFSAEQHRRIHIRLDPQAGEVVLDPVQIAQVLHNLVDNALKYSPPDQPVDVAARPEGSCFVLEVLDRGPGLPEGHEQQIFERFYRAPVFQESAVPGVGIGLAVCRGLVEAHGGQLTACNAPAGGAVFRITLPAATRVTTGDPDSQHRAADTKDHARTGC